MSKQDIPVILHNDNRGLLSVEDGQLDVLQLSADGRPPKRLLSCPTRLVLRARLAASQGADKPRRLDLHTLGQKGEHSHTLHLKKIHVLVEPTHQDDAEEWINVLMEAAYPVTKPNRRVLLIVNPFGGKGKARQVVKSDVLPILEAAGCVVDMRETTHRNHAEEIARDMELKYDVIATASGDGIIYELLNGMAQRPDAKRSMRTPIAPIPLGSGCAASVNLFGIKDGFNVPLAVLNVIKGQKMTVDLCSILLMPSKERRVFFLSTALGLMVDLDIGTEHLRWMGDSRFIYGFLRGVAQSKPLKARIRLDVIESDKDTMAAEARQKAAEERGPVLVGGGTDPLELIRGVQKMAVSEPDAAESSQPKPAAETEEELDDGPLPPAHPLQPDDSWLTLESLPNKTKDRSSSISSTTSSVSSHPHRGNWEDGFKMLYLYAGLMPWVSRDLNQWPVLQPASGAIEVAVQRVAPRNTLLSNITGAEQGEPYWDDSQHYYRVRAFTAENLDKKSQPSFTLDGEGLPWDSFHVEVLPSAACFLSLDGRFYHSDFVTKHHTHGNGKKKSKPLQRQHSVGGAHGHGHAHSNGNGHHTPASRTHSRAQ